MGIGIRFTSPVPKPSGLLARFRSADVLGEVERATQAFSSARDIGELCRVLVSTDDSREVQVHPAEEPVIFGLEADRLTVSARSSSAGPGYYTFVLELMAHLADACDLDWHYWHPEEDDGNFYPDPVLSFEDITDEMAGWLRNLAGTVNDADPENAQSVCLDIDLAKVVKPPAGMVAAPRGFYSQAYFAELLNCSDEDLSAHASAWFPWSRCGPDAEFWRRAGEVVLWQQVSWHVPASDDEVNSVRLALFCFEQAQRLSPAVEVPETAMDELRRFSEAEAVYEVKPSAEGPGYLRAVISRPLPSDWSIDLPGYWYFECDDDGTSYWYEEATMWASTLTVENKDGKPPGMDELAITARSKDPDEDFVEDGRLFVLKVEEGNSEDDTNFVAHAYVITNEQLLLLTFYFDDRAGWDRLRGYVLTARAPT